MNGVLIVIVILFIAEKVFGYGLDLVNLSYMRKNGGKVPPEFDGIMDSALLEKTHSYELAKTRFGVFTGIFDDTILAVFLFAGLLNLYNNWVSGLNLPFILSGIIFMLLLTYLQTILGIPFSLYSTFKIENKFGFNTMTAGLWIADFIKSIILTSLLLGVVLGAGLWIVQASPGFWWLFLWLFFFLFSLFMMVISPYVIEPLFNKFTPVGDDELEQKIKEVLAKTGIKVSRVFKMDASKRSKHSNAYFSGIGHTKRIVLFDTLLQQMDHDEIVSVLAHEAGHWKKKHVLKTLAVYEIVSLVVFYLSYQLIQSGFLNQIFRLDSDTLFAKAFVLAILLGLAGFFFAPLSAYFSRRNEREADRYAVDLTGGGKNLANALKKLSKDNLSNLFPHPLYVIFHYSHPPIVERIKMIEGMKKN